MAQFAVHRNADPVRRKTVPFLLDVQNDLLSGLPTRLVIPLFPASEMKANALRTLTPIVEIAGKSYVAMTTEAAGLPRQVLGPEVASLAARRGELVAALDLLITGI